MTLLLGQETEGTGASLGVSSEIGQAFMFTNAKTGKVEALHITLPETGTGTKGKLAIQEVEEFEAGKFRPKNESVLVEGEIPSIAAGTHEVAVAATEIKEGTKYYLTFLPLGGTAKYKQGSTTGRRTTGTNKHNEIKLFKGTEWGTESNVGPISIWASGSTKTTVEATVALRSGPQVSDTAVRSAQTTLALVTGTPAVAFTGQKSLVATLSLRAGTRLASTAQRAGQAAVTVATGARDAFTVRRLGQAAVALQTGARNSTAAQAVVAATIRVRTGVTVAFRVVEKAAKRTIIMIFED